MDKKNVLKKVLAGVGVAAAVGLVFFLKPLVKREEAAPVEAPEDNEEPELCEVELPIE